MNEQPAQPFATHLLAATEARLIAADAAWIRELAATFGPERIDEMAARPEGRGREGSELRILFEARNAASVAWRAARGLD